MVELGFCGRFVVGLGLGALLTSLHGFFLYHSGMAQFTAIFSLTYFGLTIAVKLGVLLPVTVKLGEATGGFRNPVMAYCAYSVSELGYLM